MTGLYTGLGLVILAPPSPTPANAITLGGSPITLGGSYVVLGA